MDGITTATYNSLLYQTRTSCESTWHRKILRVKPFHMQLETHSRLKTWLLTPTTEKVSVIPPKMFTRNSLAFQP